MTNEEILYNAHEARRALMEEIIPYIDKKIDFNKINGIYIKELSKYTDDIFSYAVDTPKINTLKKMAPKKLKDIFIYLYLLLANVTNAYISYLDEDTSAFFSNFDLYEETDQEKINQAEKAFKEGSLLDDEMLEFCHAEIPEDASLIVRNNMIDIYFIQKLTHYKKYPELLIILNQVNILGSLRNDYIYSFIIKIFNLIK